MIYYDYDTIKFSPYTAIIMMPNNLQHRTAFWKITYAVNGTSEQITNGVKRLLTKSSVLFVKPGDVHRIVSYSGDNYKHRDIYVSDEKMRKICDFLPGSLYAEITESTPFFEINLINNENLEMALNEFPSNNPERNDYLSMQHTAVVVSLLSLFAASKNSAPVRPEWIETIFSRTQQEEFLHNNVAYLIKDIPYCQGHICREFKKYSGSTLSAYLNNSKIVYSINLLMDENYTITDIAYKLGFSTQSSFIKAFKTYFFVSPGAWRKKILKNKSTKATKLWGASKKTPAARQ